MSGVPIVPTHDALLGHHYVPDREAFGKLSERLLKISHDSAILSLFSVARRCPIPMFEAVSTLRTGPVTSISDVALRAPSSGRGP